MRHWPPIAHTWLGRVSVCTMLSVASFVQRFCCSGTLDRQVSTVRAESRTRSIRWSWKTLLRSYASLHCRDRPYLLRPKLHRSRDSWLFQRHRFQLPYFVRLQHYWRRSPSSAATPTACDTPRKSSPVPRSSFVLKKYTREMLSIAFAAVCSMWFSRYTASVSTTLCTWFRVVANGSNGWCRLTDTYHFTVCCDPQNYNSDLQLRQCGLFDFAPHHRTVGEHVQLTSGNLLAEITVNIGRWARSREDVPLKCIRDQQKVQKRWRSREHPSLDVVATPNDAHLEGFHKQRARYQVFWERNYSSTEDTPQLAMLQTIETCTQEDESAMRSAPFCLSKEETDEPSCDGLLLGSGGSDSDGAGPKFKRRAKSRS